MDARGNNRTFEEYDATTEWSHGADASAVKIILPGFKKEEIRVLVDSHGNLRTRGERPLAGNRWSRFQKDFQVPGDCNVDGIRAKFENEVLTITLPKKIPSLQQAAPMPAPTRPEPRRPVIPPPHRPPPALPEPPKPSAPTPRAPVLPPAPSQRPLSERRPSPSRKPLAPEPARPAPPVPAPTPEVERTKKYNGDAASPELAAVPKPTEEWVKTKERQAGPEEEDERLMKSQREARGKMEEDRKMMEDRKMVEEKEKKAKEEERMMDEMDMAQRRRPVSASHGLLVNVAVAVVVLIGITVYVWRNLSGGRGGGGDHGVGDVRARIYGDEM